MLVAMPIEQPSNWLRRRLRYAMSVQPARPNTKPPTHWLQSVQTTKRIAAMRKLCLLLLLLTCVLIASGCATTSPPATPAVYPRLPPPPANVMRSPNYEQRLRAILFESDETPTTKSEPSKP